MEYYAVAVVALYMDRRPLTVAAISVVSFRLGDQEAEAVAVLVRLGRLLPCRRHGQQQQRCDDFEHKPSSVFIDTTPGVRNGRKGILVGGMKGAAMRADTANVIMIVILGAVLFMETHEGFRRVVLWTVRVLALVAILSAIALWIINAHT
jgi:hypothetical protein